MMGAAQLAMGLARLGALVNFISHTVDRRLHRRRGTCSSSPRSSGTSSASRSTPARASSPRWRGSAARSRRSTRAITATGCVTLVVRDCRRSARAADPVHDRRDDRGQPRSATCSSARPAPPIPVVGALPSALPAALAALVRSRDLAQARPGGAGAHRARADRGRVDRARHRAEVGPAHRRQPGIHRPGAVEHRRRVLLGVSVVGLVQPQRRQLRGRRAHAAGRRRLRRSCSSIVLLVVGPLVAWLPLAVMAALLFVVAWGLIDVRGDAPRLPREPRRCAGARRHVRRRR